MSLFIHEGPGFYIGSTVIVSADSRMSAESLIRKELDATGLTNEKLNVRLLDDEPNTVLFSRNGDY